MLQILVIRNNQETKIIELSILLCHGTSHDYKNLLTFKILTNYLLTVIKKFNNRPLFHLTSTYYRTKNMITCLQAKK